MPDERIVSAVRHPNDDEAEGTLRPLRFAEYVGQAQITQALRIFVEAAAARGEALDHVLLSGPPGLGKTTLAYVIANELGVGLRTTAGPAIEHQGDMVALLTSLEPRDILFIDEIHRLRPPVEEVLYPAMEDGFVDIIIGRGPGARSVRVELPPFTLLGATTRAGLLTSPLRDRFGVIHRLDYYSEDELVTILNRSAAVLGVPLEPEGAREIARRSRGTPRVANRLLRRVRDFAEIRADGRVTGAVAREALDLLGVDPLGLDPVDRKLLTTIIDKYEGGPVGLETLSASVGEESDTIMDVYEPFLLRLGFIKRTPRGRVASRLAYDHVNRTPPDAAAAAEG